MKKYLIIILLFIVTNTNAQVWWFANISNPSPKNLSIINIIGGIRLSWDDVINEDGYEIWVSINGASYSLLNVNTADVITYDDLVNYSGLPVNYKIRSYKGIGYSDYTNISTITITPDILNFATNWINDFCRITFNGVSGWQTEIYSSFDNTNWTLVTTMNAGVETYDDYTWQGITMYYKARAKNVGSYGDYCTTVSLNTPLVYKVDENPTVSYALLGSFNLPVGKTIHIDWGNGTSVNVTTTQTAICNYSVAQDPYYIKLSGDITSITEITISGSAINYGDLSKWYLPLSCLKITALSSAFSGIPRGNLIQINDVNGIYLYGNNCSTAEIDAFLAYANAYFVTNIPIKNSAFRLHGSPMGIPTGGNNNADRLGIIAKFAAAGYTATISVNN